MNGGHVPKPPFKARAVGSNMSKPPTHPTTPSTLPCNLTQVVAGGSSAESNLFWALVYVPQGTTAGSTQHRNCRGNPDAGGGRWIKRRKQPLLGARVCPSGDNCRALNIATAGATPGSMYEPNQFVMNCGVIDPTAGPIRIYSPISRNLNDGDKISLLIRPTLDGAATMSLSVCAMLSLSIK